MKKTALFIVTLAIVLNVNAQIGITSVTVPQPKPSQIPVFDSTQNFLGTKNVQSYNGQILFVLPKAKTNSVWGYESFKSIDYNPRGYSGPRSHYGRDSERSIFNTRYEDLAEKYFRVDSIAETSHTEYLFYLTNTKDETDRCCFIYSGLYKHTFPFIVLSHFNFLKDNYLGKQYIIQSNLIHHTDIVTGDSIIIKDDPQVIWTTTDLTIIDNDYRKLAFVIKSGNVTSYVDAEIFASAFTTDGRRIIYNKIEWDNLVKKYGLTMMNLVLNRKIKVGMPEKLLVYSWGKAERINSSSYGNQQYVYGNDYVYVKDGKVVSWQSSH